MGALIRGFRLRARMSQAQLAAASGVAIRTVRDIEQGRVDRPRPRSLLALAGALRLSPAERATLTGDVIPVRAGPIGLLGPLTGPELPPMPHLLLELLALKAGEFVGYDEITDVLWGEGPPASSRSQIQTFVARLRAALDPAPLRLDRGGYRLDVVTDAQEFLRLAADARRADPAGAVVLLDEALRLWRGPVLAGASDRLRAHPAVAALSRSRVEATLAYAQAAVRTGRDARTVGWLEQVAATEPFHEELHAALMLAMGRGGDRMGALRVFDGIRDRLAAEFGVDPGAALRRARDQVLAGEGTDAAVPAQLPADVALFTGRDDQLRRLDVLLTPAHRGAVVVTAVAGTAGVGKTALAVHWAHRVRHHFPDGQLYVNLRGWSDDRPVTASEALGRFLRALGEPPERVPSDLDEAAGQYRSLVAGRRMLVVLDNAATASQVRPLLPGGDRCATVVTSRDRLDGLVARDGAGRVDLDVLSAGEGRALLHRAIGLPVSATVDTVVALCGGLPLALRIAAARIAGTGLSSYAAALSAGRLASLEVDGDSGVRAAFQLSYAALPPAAQALFRELGNAPGSDVSELVLPSPHFGLLVGAHLVTLAGPGRYAMHDLIRLFARERTACEDTADERQRVRRRLLTRYRDIANAADRVLRPAERPNFDSPPPGFTFPDEAAALRWLDTESGNLTSAVLGEVEPDLEWQIAAAMFGWLVRRQQRDQWITLYLAAMVAAQQAGDRAGQALIARRLGIAYATTGKVEDAVAAFRRAHDLCLADGDLLGAATALLNVGAAEINGDRPQAAIVAFDEATSTLAGLSTTGAEVVHFRTLLHSNLGEAHRAAGNPAVAMRHYEEALRIGDGVCADRDIAKILIEAAILRLDLGDPRHASADARRGLRLAGTSGDLPLVAEANEALGRLAARGGDIPLARHHFRLALDTFTELGHYRTQDLRDQLAALEDR